jgi:hypothetical protein
MNFVLQSIVGRLRASLPCIRNRPQTAATEPEGLLLLP